MNAHADIDTGLASPINGRDALGEPASRLRSPVTLGILAVLALAGIAVLMALGIWQLQRRVWKLDLIARVEQRIHAAPITVPGPGVWSRLDPVQEAYRHVSVTGRFLNDRETAVQAVTDIGPGFWILTPLRTADGAIYLVNRGFVPPERRDPATRAAANPAGEVTVAGLLRASEPKGGFLRTNDPPGNRWFSRDVEAIAAARGLSQVAPFFIDADATRGDAAGPVGGLTVVSFPNNHLVYALTWFALAALLAGASVFVARDEWRARHARRTGTAPGTR